MKKILVLLLFPLVVLFISSCAVEPAGPAGIDSVEDAERAADIVFEATFIGRTQCEGSYDPPCIILEFPDGGTIELCLADPEVLSGSQFYDELDFSNGLVFNLTFSDVEVTCPETEQEYILNGDLAFFGSFSAGEASFDIVFLLYGAVDIGGEDFSDTAEMDVKYTCHVEYTGDAVVITGSVEGTVNEYEITDMDWEYTIPCE